MNNNKSKIDDTPQHELPKEAPAHVIDLGSIITQKMNDLFSSGTVHKMITDGIEKTIQAGVADALGSYSLKNLISKEVEKNVSTIVSSVGFSAYNTYIGKTVNELIHGTMAEDLQKKIQNNLNLMLVQKRESITIEELIEEYRKYINNETDEEEQHNRGNWYMSAAYDERHQWWEFVFAPEDDEIKPSDSFYSKRSKTSDAKGFTLSKNHTILNGFSILSVYIKGREGRNSMEVRYMDPFDLFVLNLYMNKTIIIIPADWDPDDESTEYEHAPE